MAVTHILAIDLSLVGTGWARYYPENGGTFSFGVIDASRLRGMERIEYILDHVKMKTSVVNGTVGVVIENFAYGAKGQAVHEIGMLHGVIRHMLYVDKIPHLVITPTCLKKFVTGKGNCKKDLMLLEVYKRWAVSTKDDNEADAFGLMQMGRVLIGAYPDELTNFQRDSIANITDRF